MYTAKRKKRVDVVKSFRKGGESTSASYTKEHMRHYIKFY
jgi:hypothetical protein